MGATINILLADDDKDDCLLFKDVLIELPLSVVLSIVSNGEQLMKLLNEKDTVLPDILFLDLNMPRKNGFKCLLEIKESEKLKQVPVIIFSTSYQRDVIDLLYKNGAHHYIRKPNDFSILKDTIYNAIILTMKSNFAIPSKAEFELPYLHVNEQK